jgi:hypothetical protein
MFQEILPRTIFHISNNISPFEDPEASRALYKLVYSGQTPEVHTKLDLLQGIIDPVIHELGLFQKTLFQCLFIEFSLNASPQLKHKIALRSSKADRHVAIDRIFLKEELLTALQGDFVSFALGHVREMLFVLCKKYDLDSEPLNRLSQKEVNSKELADLADTVIEEPKSNELRIYIRLTDDQFGDPEEVDVHARFIDDIEDLLRERDLGEIDGSELGMGYRDIYCAGDDANAMYECIAERLNSLPAGSYIEVVGDDDIKRIELGAPMLNQTS